MRKGVIYAALCYFIWGFFPIYFKLISAVPALQIVAHRIIWSFLFLAALVVFRKDFARLRPLITRKTVLIYGLSAVLLSANWLVYVWGVNAGYVVETSLGYYINPLVSVLLGVIILRERLRPIQWLPVGIAAAGVIYLTIGYGSLPWIALFLAFTFGLYGLIKKTAPLNAMFGLTLETSLLFLAGLAYVLYLQFTGQGALGKIDLRTTILLLLSGPVTIIPLLLFASGARRIPLTTLGLLQYTAPTLQFLVGVFIYGEPFTTTRVIGFSIIWLALIIFSVENLIMQARAVEPISS